MYGSEFQGFSDFPIFKLFAGRNAYMYVCVWPGGDPSSARVQRVCQRARDMARDQLMRTPTPGENMAERLSRTQNVPAKDA
jgi:hypothetical protein